MTPELWQRLKPLFYAARVKDANARAGFVAEMCGTDSELKRHLVQMLEADASATGPLDNPAVLAGRLIEPLASSPEPGTMVLGRFRIVRLLGRGGMGEVFEARDLQMGRIALKMIRRDLAASPIALARFRREVKLARRVSGAQICRIHELFLLPSTDQHPPTAFLTMEYLDGETLSRRLEKGGPLPIGEALPIALDICEGLRLIHQQGIVHRDLKCANIMLCNQSGRARAILMDFGLALDSSRSNAPDLESTASASFAYTELGTLAGTPAYMAPEQFEGKAVTPATDIYALGVVLYELLTGLHPFAAATPVGAAIRRAKRPDPISMVQHRIPRHWDAIVEKCLQYEPERRFQSAEEVARALQAGPLNLHNLAIDRPWLAWLGTVLLLSAASWGIIVWWQSRQYYQPNPEGERWYLSGLSALREASYLKAARALENATAQDGRFVMAHARLAEAWANLDFDGRAQHEMLIASAGENRIPSLDRMYLDAIRATLTRDFKSSVDLYTKILSRLPDAEKPAGYLDLGMAYERAGKPQRALEDYEKASSLNPDNPAPWLRTGMVETRLNRMAEANQAFGRAEALYAAEMNPEGQAELDNQRGYMASLSGHLSDAETYLKHSIDEAQRISNVQLEIRSLTQLSSIECASGRASEAVTNASEGITLARDHQQDAWAAMGLARLAQARLVQGSAHYGEAESAVNEAHDLAIQTGQGRALALADAVLASLRDQQGRPDDVVKPASDALKYYRENGYFEPAAGATLLLLRAETSRGDLNELLRQSQMYLSLAQTSGNPHLLAGAEDNLGTAYSMIEQYPEALIHFQKAMELATTDLNRGYEAKASAAILAKLGRFDESRKVLAPAGSESQLKTSVAAVETDSLLMQALYSAALERSSAVLGLGGELTRNEKQEFQRKRAVAESHLGRGQRALTDTLAAMPSDSENDKRSASLQEAEITMLAGRPNTAVAMAADLLQAFRARRQLDSALRSALIAAAACHLLDRDADRDKFLKQAVDIVSALKHNWGESTLPTYLSRPDIRLFLSRAAVPNWADTK